MFILSMKQLQEKKDVLEKETCRRFKSSNNGSCHFQIFQYSSRLSKEFMDPSASRKRYQSVLKSFQNNKKKPCVPTKFHNKRFGNNFKEKADPFPSFFAKQY